MQKMKNLYITTAIDYANGKPHIGHAYEKILADTLSRIKKLQGGNVFFMTGLDEHGQKVQQSAEKNNIEPQEFCDKIAGEFKSMCESLNINYDRYIRTTDADHKKTVQDCLQKLFDNGEIYEAEYSGSYSVSAERFVQEKDKVNGEWPFDFGQIVEISEKNYFFKLKKYQQWLHEYIGKHPDFIYPKFRAKQVLEFLKEPINDLCISRPKERLSWGIELPFNTDYVTYVWFDALLNYVTGAGFGTENFEKIWPADIHVIGKDILVPAHAIYWPIMLHALGIELPKQLLVHGWWLASGEKMSKSLGNVVNPLECIEKFGTDAFRYFMMREMSVGHDCDFIPERFVTRYTADLGNDLGNLLSRLLNMGQRYCDGVIPQSTINEQPEIALKNLWSETEQSAINDCDNLCFNCALEKIFFFISAINRYIETRAPWQLAKSQDETDKQRLMTTLGVTAEALRLATVLLQPVMPGVCAKILSSLGINETLQFKGNLAWSDSLVGKHFGDKIILFPRLECNDKCK